MTGRVGKADQALAVPATPVPVDGPSGFDPSRSEQSLRDKFNFLLGARGKPTEFAKTYGLCGETVLAFLRGKRPPADKLLEALGYRREYRYSPCPCFACAARRTDLDPGTMQFGVPLEMQRMFLCEHCGNKRCPHATNHIHECTGSNEPWQPGSAYEWPANAALATEAGTAETPQSGSVHEGAGPQDNAQNQSPSNDIGVDKP